VLPALNAFLKEARLALRFHRHRNSTGGSWHSAFANHRRGDYRSGLLPSFPLVYPSRPIQHLVPSECKGKRTEQGCKEALYRAGHKQQSVDPALPVRNDGNCDEAEACEDRRCRKELSSWSSYSARIQRCCQQCERLRRPRRRRLPQSCLECGERTSAACVSWAGAFRVVSECRGDREPTRDV
jgi:hypothetical protein